MKIKFLVVALMTVLALVLFVAPVSAAASGFYDVLIGHLNYTAIMGLKERHIISGYPDGSYKPGQTVNRVEALKIILLGSGIIVPDASGTGGFKDTEAEAWYAKYILKAQLADIVQGYPDGTFKPEQTVNLAESLKILLKAKNIDISTVKVNEDPYVDVPKTGWYAPYAQYAKEHNLIDADSRNMIYPARGMTRAQFAEMIYRLVFINEYGLEKFTPSSTVKYETDELSIEVPKTWEIIEKNTFTPDVPESMVVVFRNSILNENYTANVNINKTTLQKEMSTLEYAKGMIDAEKAGLIEYRELSKIETEIMIGIDEIPTYFVSFEAKISSQDMTPIKYFQIFGVNGNNAWIVTGALSSLEDDSVEKIVEDIVKSFRLEKLL